MKKIIMKVLGYETMDKEDVQTIIGSACGCVILFTMLFLSAIIQG